MRKYWIYKFWSRNTHLSETIAEEITMICLGMMGNNRDAYGPWRVGITNNPNITYGNNFRRYTCQSNIQARHTKAFLLYKGMTDDTNAQDINGIHLYIYR